MDAAFLKRCYNFLFGCVIKRLYLGALNQRNLLTLPLNFLLNFSVLFIWLMIFKHAGMIPPGMRPTIHSKVAFYLDNYMFGDSWGEMLAQLGKSSYYYWTLLTSALFCVVFLLVAPLSIWYYVYYVRRLDYNLMEWSDHIFHFNNRSNPKRVRALCIPFLLPFFAFVGLNIVHVFAKQTEENFADWKDLIAWFSYVILHLTAPILTSVYLYVFHPPGTLKCFALALGIQNLMGVTTHLLIPMAPPWFVHMYGIMDTEHVNYTQQGFAAGLTRVDAQLGTHLNTAGFHMSPIVFGAVPSLHSAMAFQCFLFLVTRSTTFKGRCAGSQLQPEPQPLPLELHKNSCDVELQVLDQETSRSRSSSEDRDLNEELPAAATGPSATGPSATGPSASGTWIAYYNYDAQFARRWYFSILERARLPCTLGTCFLIWQWWSTIYLDHHYRFDLFIGMLYALLVHILINQWLLQPRVLQPWLAVRLQKVPDTRNEGRTMGMRVFQHTNMEWFFDPLA